MAERHGLPDGQVRPDHTWARRLRRLMDTTPLAPTLATACEPLARCNVDTELLLGVISDESELWVTEGKLAALGLPADFLDFAIAIYVYSETARPDRHPARPVTLTWLFARLYPLLPSQAQLFASTQCPYCRAFLFTRRIPHRPKTFLSPPISTGGPRRLPRRQRRDVCGASTCAGRGARGRYLAGAPRMHAVHQVS